MKKLFQKNRILQQFLSDNVLMDESIPIPDYYFVDECLMEPFYLVIQAIKALNSADLFYAQTLMEEFDTYQAPFLTGKLVLAMLRMEKGEMKDARNILEELRPAFTSRSTLHRFYLRSQDSVYRADYRLFKKWFPLTFIRLLTYTDDLTGGISGGKSEGLQEELAEYRALCTASGVDKVWVDRYETQSRMSYYRNIGNLSAQEDRIASLLDEYDEAVGRLDYSMPEAISTIENQTAFLVQQIFHMIEQYESTLQHKKTLLWCDRILLLQPKNQKVLVAKVEALKKMNRCRCALGFCNTFIQNDPHDSVGYYLRSNTYFLMKENKKALEDAQACYERSSDKKLGLLARGFSLLNLEQYEKAAGCFEIVCSMGNPSYEALRGLGKAYASMDRTIDALECYIQCKRIDPIDLDLMYDIADTQFMGGYFEEAKKSCFACLKQNANFVGSYVILGMIAMREEKEALALKYFDKTLQLDSKNPYALNEKGFLCHLSGDDEKAKDLIDQALLEFPDYADALCNKGIICCLTDDFDIAHENFDKALAIIPDHLGASMGKANVLLHEEKIEEALEWFESILKIYPDNEEALNCREAVLKIMGMPTEEKDDDKA